MAIHFSKEHLSPWRHCTDCEIGNRASRHVIGRGNLPCDILFVGEAPGKQEDMKGLPFVGPSGKILDTWIAYASEQHIKHEGYAFTYYITNLVSCRPCDITGGPNRAPTQSEITNCRPRISLVHRLANPRSGVVLLGKIAYENIQLGSMYRQLELPHPAYILRCGGVKCKASIDAQEKLFEFIRPSIP